MYVVLLQFTWNYKGIPYIHLSHFRQACPMKSAETDHVPTMYFSVHGCQFQYTAVHPGPSACDVNNPGITVKQFDEVSDNDIPQNKTNKELGFKCNKKSSFG